MKKIALSFVLLSLLCPSQSFTKSCAVEKDDEYQKLADELYKLDPEEAFGAKEAYKIVRMFEAVAGEQERCKKMDRLLEDMRDAISTAR